MHVRLVRALVREVREEPDEVPALERHAVVHDERAAVRGPRHRVALRVVHQREEFPVDFSELELWCGVFFSEKFEWVFDGRQSANVYWTSIAKTRRSGVFSESASRAGVPRWTVDGTVRHAS